MVILGALAAFLIAGKAAAGASAEGEETVDDWNRYDALFKKYASRYGLPWEWLKAIALNESDLGRDPLVVNHQLSRDGKSKGLMQLTLPTAQDYKPDVTLDELDDPELSVDLAAQYLAYLYRRYAGDPQKVIMSYNQGQGNTDAGKTYALGYFQRWQRNLNQVEENV